MNLVEAFVWGERGSHLCWHGYAYSPIACKQLCQAVFSQRLILWEPSKRIFKWADRWGRVRERAGVGWGGVGWRSPWLMVQWHVVAAEFMSQSKSEYWEHGHRVTLTVLRIIWRACYVGDLSRKRWACSPPWLKLQPAVMWGGAPLPSLWILCGQHWHRGVLTGALFT